jgi:hypothetical protein
MPVLFQPRLNIPHGFRRDHIVIPGVRRMAFDANQSRTDRNIRPVLYAAQTIAARADNVPGHQKRLAFRRQQANDGVGLRGFLSALQMEFHFHDRCLHSRQRRNASVSLTAASLLM